MRKLQVACRPLTDAEVAKMRAWFAGRPRDGALLEVMLSSARVGEATALTVGDVWDGQNVIPQVSIKGEKGDRGKLLLTPSAQKAIRAWLDRLVLSPETPLFPSEKTGRSLTTGQVRRILTDAFLRLGINGAVSTHSCRKTWARWMAEADKSLLFIRDAGRWKWSSSVDHYVKHDPTNQAAEIAAIERAHTQEINHANV